MPLLCFYFGEASVNTRADLKDYLESKQMFSSLSANQIKEELLETLLTRMHLISRAFHRLRGFFASYDWLSLFSTCSPALQLDLLDLPVFITCSV